jgi:hypothetical protein
MGSACRACENAYILLENPEYKIRRGHHTVNVGKSPTLN